MTDDELETVEAMIRYGGGFVHALGHAWRLADAPNRARLLAAFPEYWGKYRTLAAIDREIAENRS